MPMQTSSNQEIITDRASFVQFVDFKCWFQTQGNRILISSLWWCLQLLNQTLPVSCHCEFTKQSPPARVKCDKILRSQAAGRPGFTFHHCIQTEGAVLCPSWNTYWALKPYRTACIQVFQQALCALVEIASWTRNDRGHWNRVSGLMEKKTTWQSHSIRNERIMSRLLHFSISSFAKMRLPWGNVVCQTW